MLLAIDAGNTNVVFGLFEGETKRCQWRAATRTDRTADEYAALLTQWLTLEGLTPASVKNVVIASVVPRLLRDLRLLSEKVFHCKPMVVGDEGIVLGIEVKYRKDEIGSDRLADAIAAHVAYKGPLIVIDFGTATTFNVIDANGNYCGGAIAPGVNLTLEALHAAAAKLPRITVEEPERTIGLDTVSAMNSGIYWGYIGLIEGLTARIKAELGGASKIKVVATGGLAPLFAHGTKVVDHVDPDLTLRGLVEIFRRNARVASKG